MQKAVLSIFCIHYYWITPVNYWLHLPPSEIHSEDKIIANKKLVLSVKYLSNLCSNTRCILHSKIIFYLLVR